ncbi:MAG: hypothetical protein GY696_02130 [Gammaproteobacteria bacterium]|nr:hypothetical protein [Gammaproteobacteria bacterium]
MKPSDLEVTQINLHHSKGASGVLVHLLAGVQTSVALIQEPWIVYNKVSGLRLAGGTLHWDTTCLSPRACIATSRNLDASLLPQLSSRDTVAVRIECSVAGVQRSIVFASVYLPYDSVTPPPSLQMERIVSFCQSNSFPLVIGCDANAHNTVWGSSDTNRRGATLLDYLGSTDLQIINRGDRPTFVITNRREVIDITLASSEVSNAVGNWRVSDEESLSDHRLIRFSIPVDSPPPVLYRNPRATDWVSYNEELCQGLEGDTPAVWTSDQIEVQTSRLQSAIVSAYEASCPLKRAKSKRGAIWWNRGLSKLRQGCRRKFRRASDARAVDADWADYTESRREYKREIRRAKRQSWRVFCEGVEGQRPTARLHRLLGKEHINQPDFFTLPSGELTTSREESLLHLLQVHFPGCSTQVAHIASPHAQEASLLDWEVACEIVTEARIRWAIKSFAPYKAAGEDKIFPALLQKGLEVILKPLKAIFRACIALGYIPVPWRAVRVIFIPKPGKPCYSVAKAHRPISLTSFLLKSLERLVDWFLREGVLMRNPLHKCQHAYLSGKSTESALHQLVGRVEAALERKEYALTAFLDIEGAFDNATFQSMLGALAQRGVEPVVVRWIGCMLRQRVVRASIGGCTMQVAVSRGCPQGGVLSPILWNLVVDELLVRLTAAGFFVQGYADDIAILVAGICLSTVSGLIQEALSQTVDWCVGKELSVQAGKTELILFTHRRKIEGFRRPYLNGVELRLSPEVKYLGVILDSKLSWKAHLVHKCKKAIVMLWQCRRIVGKSWGLAPKQMLWLYIAIVRPMLCYAALVWWHRLELVTARDLVGRVQRLAGLFVTGAMRSTPGAALDALLNLPPLHLFVESEAMAACYRFSRAGAWRARNLGHSRIYRRMVTDVPLLRLRGDYVPRQASFEKKFASTIPLREEWSNNPQRLLPQDHVSFFTDGSLRSGRAGAGVFCENQEMDDQSVPLGAYATVFQAEVYAILCCAKAVIEAGYRGENIRIYSDSQAALKAVMSPWIVSSVVSECLSALNELSSNNSVTLVWVPGHVGIEGNEQSDQLANEASELPFIGPEPVLGISPGTGRSSIRDWLRRRHVGHWLFCTGCRQSKLLRPAPCAKFSRQLLAMNRQRLRPLVGVLTGHCVLNKHLFTMGLLDSPICSLCEGSEETALHFLGECEALAGTRISSLGARSLNPTQLCKYTPGELWDYLRSSGRFG